MKKPPKKTALLAAELLAKDIEKLRVLAEEIADMSATVEQFPEDAEYDMGAMDTLEEARHQALKLAHECEMVIKALTGH